MNAILLLGFLLPSIAGILLLFNAKSALHEIEAFILMLIGAVFFVGLALNESLGKILQHWKGKE